MERLKSNLQNMVGVLVGVAFVCALLLSVFNKVTSGPVAEQAAKTLQDGIKNVMQSDSVVVEGDTIVEKEFNVTVTDVRTLVRKGKKTKFSKGKHAYPGITHRQDKKFAYVKLKKGDSIKVFDEPEDDKKTSAKEAKKSEKKAKKADKNAGKENK